MPTEERGSLNGYVALAEQMGVPATTLQRPMARLRAEGSCAPSESAIRCGTSRP